jgi:pre-mRNA-splicing factor CWC26
MSGGKRNRDDEEQFEIDEDGQVIVKKIKKLKSDETDAIEKHKPKNDTVFRDSRGKVVTEDELKRRADAKKAKEQTAQKLEWGKGLVQIKKGEEDLVEKVSTAQAPLARYVDDEMMNLELRDQERWGDPMLKHKHKQDKGKNRDLKNVTTRPMYKGTPWSNRYGILPGYRWDGIDRSNGWEKRRNHIRVNAEYNAAAQEDYGAADE